jgi:hypothetical protein
MGLHLKVDTRSNDMSVFGPALNQRYRYKATVHDVLATPLTSLQPNMQKVRHGNKEAIKFVTPSGVTAFVATPASAELMRDLARKLQRKLRRRGLDPDSPTSDRSR